jgi:flagellar biosynthesis protein FlhF
MKIKKYRAASIREALIRIKEELGPDAIILKTQEFKNPSDPAEKVEVTAALDEDALPPVAVPPPTGAQDVVSGASGAYDRKGVRKAEWRNIDEERASKDKLNLRVAPPPPPVVLPDPAVAEKVDKTIGELQALRQDFAALRQELRHSARTAQEGVPVDFQPMASALARAGIPVNIAQDLLAELMIACPVEDRGGLQLFSLARKVLGNRVTVAPRPQLRKGRPLVQLFLGPTGVGKSTTIAKLAAQALLSGNNGVAIVTTDCYRMGALEQMEAFAGAAEIALETIYGPEDVQDVFERLRDKSLVLVDTAGRSRNNREHLEELKALCDAIHPDEVHLVVSLNTRDRDLEETVAQFRPMGVNRLVFTKQDETSEQGALLWLSMRTGIPLSFICSGQRIPDDICPAEREQVAGWILGEAVLT